MLRPQPGLGSYHTHSRWCDGHGEAREYVEAAIAAGLSGVGLAGHSPTAHPALSYALKASDLPAFVAERRALQEEYRGRLDVWVGLELDHLPDQGEFFDSVIAPAGFDYLLGSVHNIGEVGGVPWDYERENPPQRFENHVREHYGGVVRIVVERYYRLVRAMVEERRIDVVGHLDRIAKFPVVDQGESWYQEAVETTLQAIAATGVMVELNTSHRVAGRGDWQPARWVLKRMAALRIPVVISADAHRPENVAAGFGEASELLREVGHTHVSRLTHEGWRQVPL